MIDIREFNGEVMNAIQELRKRMKAFIDWNVYEEPVILYRFLKARDFNVDKAEKMLRNHFIWRKANQLNTIVEDFKPKEVFLKLIMASTIGYDKEGDKVIYVPSGKHDIRDLLKCFTISNYVKHWIWYFERNSQKCITDMEKIKHQLVLIIDLDKLTFASATNKSSAEIFLRIVQTFQDHYPEGMKSTYVINAPVYYVLVFSIVKTVMSDASIQKIHVFGQSGWREKLLETIDSDVLPAFLGGSRTDPDGNPLCNTFIRHGGKIPSCYYLPDENRHFTDKSDVKEICIPKYGKKEVYVEVEDGGSEIHWKFLVRNKDIGFGLFYKKSEELIEMLPIQRYDTFDGAEESFYRTKLPGKYIMVFDNSYSWLNSKDVEYCVKVFKI